MSPLPALCRQRSLRSPCGDLPDSGGYAAAHVQRAGGLPSAMTFDTLA